MDYFIVDSRSMVAKSREELERPGGSDKNMGLILIN